VPLVLCLAGFLAIASPLRQESLLVSAAISLTDALQEIGHAYTKAGNAPVRFNFAGSNVLARQIVNGAPADVFISADEAQMNYADERGAIDRASRFDLASNRLVIVTPRGSARTIADAATLAHARRIAAADPTAVPAGVYARQFLEKAGIWDRVRERLVPLGNVRAALAAAESSAVDAAIVYESDAATSSRVDVAFVVTGAPAPRIVYPAAIVARSKNRDAAAKFLAFLRSAEAKAILRKYRFS
jgi:molybdate transport system substrate-binding protein